MLVPSCLGLAEVPTQVAWVWQRCRPKSLGSCIPAWSKDLGSRPKPKALESAPGPQALGFDIRTPGSRVRRSDPRLLGLALQPDSGLLGSALQPDPRLQGLTFKRSPKLLGLTLQPDTFKLGSCKFIIIINIKNMIICIINCETLKKKY